MAEITRRRTGEHLRTLFRILLDNPGGLPAREALAALAEHTKLTEYELGFYDSGDRCFEKIIGVANDGGIVGIERDQLETDDKFMRHLAQTVRNGFGDRAGTCIDPTMQLVDGRTVCVVSCQRSPEPVFLRWKEMEGSPEGDFFVRSGPGTVKLSPDDARQYVRTRFPT